MTKWQWFGVACNLGAALFNLLMLVTRHRRLLRERDYWHELYVRAMPFVLLITHSPLKQYVDPSVRAKGEELVPNELREDIAKMELAGMLFSKDVH